MNIREFLSDLVQLEEPVASLIAGEIVRSYAQDQARRSFRSLEVAAMAEALGLETAAVRAIQEAALADPWVRIHLRPRAVGANAGDSGHSILLAASPRAGNTIVRKLIGTLGYSERAYHSTEDFDPNGLVPNSIVQLHERPLSVGMKEVAEKAGTVVTIARHPIDLLLSVRSFAQREPQVRYWLTPSAVPNPGTLHDVDEFHSWTLSNEAERLLAVSVEWWRLPSTIRLRYEEVVSDPVRLFATVFNRLPHLKSVGEEEARRRLLTATGKLPRSHITKGGPGAWLDIPPALASELGRRHAEVFQTLGYPLP